MCIVLVMKNLLIAFALGSCFFTPAVYAGGGGSSSSSSSGINIDWNEGVASQTANHTSVMEQLGVDEGSPRVISMPSIVVPLVVNHRLQGYAYIHSRLLVAQGGQARNVQTNTHFALDRLIRASHRANLTAESGDTIDLERMRAVWLEALAEQFGDGIVERVAFAPPDIRLLR